MFLGGFFLGPPGFGGRRAWLDVFFVSPGLFLVGGLVRHQQLGLRGDPGPFLVFSPVKPFRWGVWRWGGSMAYRPRAVWAFRSV